MANVYNDAPDKCSKDNSAQNLEEIARLSIDVRGCVTNALNKTRRTVNRVFGAIPEPPVCGGSRGETPSVPIAVEIRNNLEEIAGLSRQIMDEMDRL